MPLEKILVDKFEFLVNNGEYIIAFDVDEGPITSAEFMYDGRNCAILTRNNKKAFLLTNIIPEMRKVLSDLNKIVILERVGKEVANAYEVDIRHVENIPYPDNFEQDVNKMIDELKEELGETEFNELIKSLSAEYRKVIDTYAKK